MPRKCPPGVICIENVTMSILFVLCSIVAYLVYIRAHPSASSRQDIVRTASQQETQMKSHYEVLMKPGHSYNNNPQDVLLNPYTPPMNSTHMQTSTPVSHPYVPPGRVPINVATSVGYMRTNYTQAGILTPAGGGNDKILALMGRQLQANRQKWQYYTISDSNNSVKLPVIKNGRSCTNEYGCDELSNGDTVFVEGYGQAFKVTVYENDSMQYIPYL